MLASKSAYRHVPTMTQGIQWIYLVSVGGFNIQVFNQGFYRPESTLLNTFFPENGI